MFPDIPEVSIRYDLLQSGSAEATCDRILRDGYLPIVRDAPHTASPALSWRRRAPAAACDAAGHTKHGGTEQRTISNAGQHTEPHYALQAGRACAKRRRWHGAGERRVPPHSCGGLERAGKRARGGSE